MQQTLETDKSIPEIILCLKYRGCLAQKVIHLEANSIALPKLGMILRWILGSVFGLVQSD